MIGHVIGSNGKIGPQRSGILARSSEAVTPSDAGAFAGGTCSGIWVGTGGNVSVYYSNGTSATYKNVPTGYMLPVEATRVNSTGTTAADMLAVFES